jgi:DICT domain-containing protein
VTGGCYGLDVKGSKRRRRESEMIVGGKKGTNTRQEKTWGTREGVTDPMVDATRALYGVWTLKQKRTHFCALLVQIGSYYG